MKKELIIPQNVWEKLNICEQVEFVVDDNPTLEYNPLNGLTYNNYRLKVVSRTEATFRTATQMNMAMPFGNLYNVYKNDEIKLTQLAYTFNVKFVRDEDLPDPTKGWKLVYTMLSGTEAVIPVFKQPKLKKKIDHNSLSITEFPVYFWMTFETFMEYVKTGTTTFKVPKNKIKEKLEECLKEAEQTINWTNMRIHVTQDDKILVIPSLGRCIAVLLNNELNAVNYISIIDLNSTLINYWELHEKMLSSYDGMEDGINEELAKEIDLAEMNMRGESKRFTQVCSKFEEYLKTNKFKLSKEPLTIGKFCNTI